MKCQLILIFQLKMLNLALAPDQETVDLLYYFTQVVSTFQVQPDEVSCHSDQKLPKNEKSLIFPPKDIEPVLTGKSEQIL